jgi:hypothetical protein
MRALTQGGAITRALLYTVSGSRGSWRSSYRWRPGSSERSSNGDRQVDVGGWPSAEPCYGKGSAA